MKRLFGLILMVSFLVISSSAQKLPDFSLEDINNKRFTYDELKGEYLTLIDFWATWCKPCVNAIPELVRIQEEFDGKLQIIGISLDGPRNQAKVRPFIESMGVPYPILLDPNSEYAGILNISAIPTLLLVGPDKKIIYSHEGFMPGDEKDLREVIKKGLSEIAE